MKFEYNVVYKLTYTRESIPCQWDDPKLYHTWLVLKVSTSQGDVFHRMLTHGSGKVEYYMDGGACYVDNPYQRNCSDSERNSLYKMMATGTSKKKESPISKPIKFESYDIF